MSRFACSVCQGVFRDPLADGTRYYHACPPLSVVELTALPIAQLRLLLPDLPAVPTAADIQAAAARTIVPRPGARDENIDPTYRGQTVRPGDAVDEDLAPRRAPNGRRIDRGV